MGPDHFLSCSLNTDKESPLNNPLFERHQSILDTCLVLNLIDLCVKKQDDQQE